MNDHFMTPYFDACIAAGVHTTGADYAALAPACCTEVMDSNQWSQAVQVAQRLSMRWCAFWASQINPGLFEACTVLECQGHYLILRTRLRDSVALASITDLYPAADRPERHAHDLLGISFSGQPDARRWTRHRAWSENDYPLQTEYTRPALEPAPADDGYPFLAAQGAGVVEIPVGPVHAGIIEPGHFRFQAVGETVLNLEERLGYVHKGIEKIAVGRDAADLVRLAGRVSGDTTVAHAWAACQAMERAVRVEVPPRALSLRAILAERERIANHLGDIAAICNDVSYAFAFYQLMRLKENWLRENLALCGHRLLMDIIVPGGIAAEPDAQTLTAMSGHCQRLKATVEDLITVFEASETLEDRLMTTGRLLPEVAAQLGTVGYVGKASGQPFDVRQAAPYAPYDGLTVKVPTYRAGDVAARAKIRADEIAISLDLIRELLLRLPDGSVRADWPAQLPGPAEGIGFVEGWRGEIITYVKLDETGRVMRFYPRDPSWLIWPALELLIQGNIVPDFPVCNKSVNGSYSGQDL